jgi:hypothetical protein
MSRDEAKTKPTLETLSRQVEELRSGMEELRSEMREEFKAIRYILEQMDIRFDTLESFAHSTHSALLALRATFKASRVERRESSRIRKATRQPREKQRA